MTPRVAAVADFIINRMDEIATRFKPGVKVTVIVRSPDFPNGERDCIVTADDLDAVLAAINIRARASAG